jgi:signal transduction histidine kinase/AmiR/NasT family two-component response regulator/HPt (histidine-containing phosphotransfer) domain-containing protein
MPSLSSFCIVVGVAIWLVIDVIRHLKSRQHVRHMDKLLRQAKQEVSDIIQLPMNMPYPLIQFNDKGDILLINAAALERFPDIDAQGIKHPALYGLMERIKLLQQAKSINRDVQIGDNYYNQTVLPVMANEQKSYIVYCYDISERAHYEAALKQARLVEEAARIEAQQANKARGDFLANMSHELRTPMNGIIGLTDALLELPLEENQNNLVKTISRSAHNLLILLNDILDFSKIEAGELAIESIPYDLYMVIQQSISLQKAVALGKGLKLQAAITQDVPRYVIGDPARLQQILNNLISNALKFTQQGSVKIALNVASRDEKIVHIALSVADTGIGIAPEKQKLVFEKFRQAEDSTARKYGGTGLGLAITKDLVELLDGNISITSELGVGSTFHINLPLEINDKTDVVSETNLSNEVAINNRANILVVDDNEVNRMVLRLHLEKMGFAQIDCASSGAAAIENCRLKAYSVILMDCQMPEMDGFQTTQRLRAMLDVQPIIIAVTADAMQGAREECFAAGMDYYISKPINKIALLQLMQKLLPANSAFSAFSSVATDEPPALLNAALPRLSDVPQNDDIIINLAYFDEITGGDISTKIIIAEAFCESGAEDISFMKSSLNDNNLKSWLAAVHKLYGASSNIGALRLANACDIAQNLSINDNEKINYWHNHILHFFSDVSDYLNNIKH